MSERKSLVIGTRGSPLALAQAHETAARLAATLGWPVEAFPLDVIRTSGDMIQDRALSEAGGKGLFTKEIDAAQLAGRVDVTVHSAKDLPNDLPDGLAIAGYLPREDARDALIAREGASLADLPRGARVGSASLRRQALLRRARPDIEVSLLRGNVGTRLQKIADGVFDATLLAMAGLRRLGLTQHVTAPLDVDSFPPAVGQGAIAIIVRADDTFAIDAVSRILCRETGLRLAAERAFLAVLDGSCRTPIAGHATIAGDRLRLTGLIARPDGSQTIEGSRDGAVSEAATLGADLGAELRGRIPPGFFGS